MAPVSDGITTCKRHRESNFNLKDIQVFRKNVQNKLNKSEYDQVLAQNTKKNSYK